MPIATPTGSARSADPRARRLSTTPPAATRMVAAPLAALALTLMLAAAAVKAQPASAADPALAAAAKESGAVMTASGLVFRSTQPGQGASPAASDTVRVHYRGTFVDGREFDSSFKRGQPIEFPLDRVIPCWTEGVQRMKVGGKARLTCPSAIAYGARGAPPVIPPNTTLVFEVELLGIRGR